jgi:hypothetical protein
MLEKSIQSYVISFIRKWYDVFYPQLVKTNYLNCVDVTEDFRELQNSKLVQSNITEGKHIYFLPYKGVRGMMEKWELDQESRIKRSKDGRGIIKISDTSVTLVPLDLIIPFITSDEILPCSPKYDAPYNISKDWMSSLMLKYSYNPEKDLFFIFMTKPENIEVLVKKFVKEFRYILEGGYLRHRVNLEAGFPKWPCYGASEILNLTSNIFFSKNFIINSNSKRHPAIRL